MKARHPKKIYQKTRSLKSFKEFERAKHHKKSVIQRANDQKTRKKINKMCESMQTMLKAFRYLKYTFFK